MSTSFDREILGLPFYEPRHLDHAQRLDRWCAGHTDLWDVPHEQDEFREQAVRRTLRALGEDGWFGFLDPANGRPADGDFRTLCLGREILAYTDDTPDNCFAVHTLAARPITRFGTDAQKARYLPGLASGELIASFALSELDRGSDIAGLGLRAERDGEDYVLNGDKAWIAHAAIADVLCVIARTGEGPGALGLTAFLVPGASPGLRVRERIAAIAPRAFAHLDFEDCRVPAECVLGRPGQGFVVAMDMLDRYRMTVGAAAVGYARRAADAALGWARARPMGEATLFDLPTIRATFADMEVKLNAAALLVARAAWETDTGNRRFARHSSIAKLHATEAAQEIVDASVQVFGAAGLVSGSVPERLYRQVRALRVYEGTSEIQKTIIASAIDPRRATPANPERNRALTER
ncbi:acyl-CoA dehydrogenase [Actinophytocola xinjiangensis]|uniref:Acyl-CoA dehydrogenase n=1 Tax=Actinophytocola xinjiangensis TaxID=485602 RepID=A0A7Z1AZY0_9PSEU|nr:acyl-CoA dehydrogenase family protein [Actinophytocola xinjiangensis]OLF14034.1 acyl-CoA dehydrogenase [Actinophytocola xinjiangensis]